MTEMTAACKRGCAMKARHLTDCDDRGGCWGCLPRRAEHGGLCWPCHRRLELMLHDLPIVYRWLTGNMAAGQGAATEGDHVSGSRELPLPIKAQVFDLRELIADRLVLWVDEVVEVQRLTGPGRHTVAADAKFLTTWLGTIERMDAIGDWWEELAEGMRDAHALAPWRPQAKRVGSIPCPECGEVNLMIFGGETDVTCGSCRLIIPERQFGLWERIVRDTAGVSA
jgi:hypothetical protein